MGITSWFTQHVSYTHHLVVGIASAATWASTAAIYLWFRLYDSGENSGRSQPTGKLPKFRAIQEKEKKKSESRPVDTERNN